MESINQVISAYRGSPTTAKMVKEEIARRYGEDEASKYNPYTSCLTFRRWLQYGYRVRKGERAIRSITYLEEKDKLGNIINTYPKGVALFHRLQVEPVS